MKESADKGGNSFTFSHILVIWVSGGWLWSFVVNLFIKVQTQVSEGNSNIILLQGFWFLKFFYENDFLIMKQSVKKKIRKLLKDIITHFFFLN